MSGHFYPPSSSPFYASQQQQQQQPPPPQQQQHPSHHPSHASHASHPSHSQQSSYGPPNAAVSPVSSYSNSPPQQPPPPLRSHTAAPYSSQGGYAPPTTGPPSYYQPQQPPQSQQQQQQQAPAPSQGGYRQQQGRPDFSPPQPRPLQPLQPRQDYGPPTTSGFSPDLPNIIANTHGLPPDVVQRLAEDLMRSIQFSNLAGGPIAVPGQGPAPLLSHPAPPHSLHGGPPPQQGSPVAASASASAPHHHQPHHQQQQQQQQQQIPGAFPSYGSGSGSAPAPQESAPGPAPPHHSSHGHQQRPSQSQHYGPQSYFPQQPVTPAMAAAPSSHSKIPVPAQGLEDGLGRKGSHRHSKSSATSGFSYNPTPTTSTSSSAAAAAAATAVGKPKMNMDDASAHYELWGELVDKEPGREPRPREKLVNLLRDIGNFMIKERPVKESIVITPDKMVDFYTSNLVEGEPLDWKMFFTGRSYSSLSSIYRALNCEHFYMPPASDQKPCIPALTPRGFETWMFTQLMSNPSREAARLQKIVSSWAINDTKENRRHLKLIPRRCFPEKEDQIIRDGWWRVWEEFPPDFEDESEEETLALPAPGNHSYGPPREQQMTPPEGAESPFASPTHRGKKPPMQIPIPYPEDDEEDERRRRGAGRSKTPLERPRKAYASESGGPSAAWREEFNPRPTLGDDMKPPTRGQAPPPPRPHTSHGHHPSVDEVEKPRGSRQRDRSEYRSRRHQSRHQSRHRRASPSPDQDGNWSGSSGISARTPGSGDITSPTLDAHAPAPAPGPPPVTTALSTVASDLRRDQKRLEELSRVEHEQRELFRKFGNERHTKPDVADPYEYEDYRHPRERERERDDRRVAEYAYQDEFDRDLRRPSAGSGPSGAAPSGAGAPAETSSRRSQGGGSGSGRWEGERPYRRP